MDESLHESWCPSDQEISPDDSWFVVVDPAGYHRPWVCLKNLTVTVPLGWSVVDGKISCQNAHKKADELNYVEEIMKS